MKRAAAERWLVGAEAAAQAGADQRTQHLADLGAAAAAVFGGAQFAQAFAVQREAAGDEQFGDQFVLGAEMIIHRREVDVGGGDDVAQRHVGKAAVGV